MSIHRYQHHIKTGTSGKTKGKRVYDKSECTNPGCPSVDRFPVIEEHLLRTGRIDVKG